MIMNNTICALVDEIDENGISNSIEETVEEVRRYVPGYRLKIPSTFDGKRVTVMIEVEGSGDYLPAYSGNLDIETCAALAVGEQVAAHLFEGKLPPGPDHRGATSGTEAESV